jgi:hypothetical protein
MRLALTAERPRVGTAEWTQCNKGSAVAAFAHPTSQC